MTRFYDEYRPTFADRGRWSSPTVLRERARTHGDRIYLDIGWTDEQYTYAETLELAERIGAAMLDAGANPGDRVLLMIPNCSAYILGWLGSSMAGLVEVPINNGYRGSFLAHQVATTEPALAVIAPEYAERFVDIADAASSIGRFYLVGGDSECEEAAEVLAEAGFASARWESLRAGGASELPTVEARDLGSIFFTSGTTGLSKGVMMPHAHMYLFADECKSLCRVTDADTYMSVGPLFHGNSQFLAAYPALIAGARYVLHERFSVSAWLEQIRTAGATVTNFVGVMMDFVWQQEPTAHDADNDLRCVFAAPTASSILEPFRERFGIEAFVEVFGLTETCMPILTPYGVERPAGAAGLLNADWFDIRLVDSETDEEVPVGEVGELVVRARYPWTTCQGYFGMPDKMAEAFRNLWFHTGDGLRRDDDGWYYFVDRLKDAIRRRGENISSYEVEQGLLLHDAIAEVAAIGVPADQEAGEDEVMVFVVLEPGAELGAEALWEFAERQLPSFAVPRYLRFVDELPKTPSEKVRKIELREQGVDDKTHDKGPAPLPQESGEVSADDAQTAVFEAPGRGRVMAMDSAYDVAERNRGRDVCVNSSYCGVLPARFIGEHMPRAAIGMDCGVGPEGSAIAGLWYLEALAVPAAVADVMTAHLGDGVHLYEHGVISFCNQPAADCGVEPRMPVREAARRLLENDPTAAAASEITNRTIMETSDDGRHVIATDSIAFGTHEDTERNVLVTVGHTGRSAVPYLRRCRPWGFICSDGGRGMDDSGMAGLYIVEDDGMAGATVDATKARMGSGLSHYRDGIISGVNAPAAARGVEIGMTAAEAASTLLQKEST